MVNRIQEILKRYNLSPSRFADELEVPRSTISHILTERNKPSLEFIQKVLDHYPDISTNWLVQGEGNIFGKQKDLFSELEQSSIEKELSAESKEHSEETIKPLREITEKPKDKDDDKYDNLAKEKNRDEESKETEIQDINQEKRAKKPRNKIIRLITFFDDNTFEEFLPSDSKDPN